MLRRSPRLQQSGYYNSEGVPTISYKETPYRPLWKRRNRRFVNYDTYSTADTIPYIDFDDSSTIPYTDVDMDMDMDTDSIPLTDFNINTRAQTEMIAEDFEARRIPTRSKTNPKKKRRKTFSFFIKWLLVLVLVYPIYALSLNTLSSMPAESPAYPFALDVACSGYCQENTMYPVKPMEALMGSTSKADYYLSL